MDLSRRFLSGTDESAEEEVRRFLLDMAREYNITALNDWHRLSRARLGGRLTRALKYLGKLPFVLKRTFPSHLWNDTVFQSAVKRAEQQTIKNYLASIFPQSGTLELLVLITFCNC